MREAALIDTFGIGFMNNGVGIAIWTMTSWGIFLAPQGNMFLGVLLSILFCTLGVALVWGMLGGSMPRSGGDYIANSRIIHPAVGVAVSMANAGFIMTFWIALLAPWVADPGMVILAGMMGWDTEWYSTTAGLFVCATIVNVWGFIIVSLGLKHYNAWQRIIMFASTFCLTVIGIVMTIESRTNFIDAYNTAAAEYGSYNYQDTIAQANIGMDAELGTGTSTSWDWGSTLMLFPAISWGTAYGYQITFICGEVKRPQRNIIMGQILAALIPGIYMLWFGWGLPRLMGGEFVQAIAYFDNGSEAVVDGFTLPSGANFVSVMGVLVLDNKVLTLIFGMMFLLYDILWMPISFIAWNRATFAWGMDRLGPMWFTDVNPRFATVIKTNYVMLLLGEVGILIYATSPSYIEGLGITTLEAMSVWGVTGISAILFAYRKRSRVIWDASPYRWRIGPIPLITIAGVINTFYIAILLYELETTEGIEWIRNNATWIYLGVWIFSVLWYFVWKRHWLTKGIDISLAWRELPPA